ncbi:hypothetical protein OU5_5851 [Pseudomonas mandelii JR-1]|uniref:RHS protein conserved region domain-containing protein n=1 Tax=Pseudomonas mandelii JR-1 TaxID=1147786 RepID=A0A024EK41_9PSED|nr:hypothetical protein OU5_5851 [Pseudomonas mandelii JR-1]
MSRERRGTGQKLVTEYRYDCQHRLIGVSLPSGSIASYKYDAFGRRIAKTVDSQTTEFLWQGERLIAESANNRYRSYIYEPGSFRPLAMLDGEGPLKAEPFYYQLDHLGTPQELTDYSGEIMWSAKYRAYGNLATLDVAEIDNPLRFQGQYFDAETGLHYNRHRYYNPGTGRYLTPDPIKLAGGLNNYRYVPNPTGWVDPLGLETIPVVCPGGPNCTPKTKSLEELVPGGSIPSVKDGAFNKWFNELTPDEFDTVWSNKTYQDFIKARLRYPSGIHEWHMVSRADTFKRWGVNAEQIYELRSAISDVKFVNPAGHHGGKGSTKAHNEILDIIDNSKDHSEFRKGLNEWAGRRLEGGADALPSGLKN